MAPQHRDGQLPDDDAPDDDAPDDEEDESVIDEMRGSGVGLEDPNIVSDTDTSDVDAQIQEDQPPEI